MTPLSPLATTHFSDPLYIETLKCVLYTLSPTPLLPCSLRLAPSSLLCPHPQPHKTAPVKVISDFHLAKSNDGLSGFCLLHILTSWQLPPPGNTFLPVFSQLFYLSDHSSSVTYGDPPPFPDLLKCLRLSPWSSSHPHLHWLPWGSHPVSWPKIPSICWRFPKYTLSLELPTELQSCVSNYLSTRSFRCLNDISAYHVYNQSLDLSS